MKKYILLLSLAIVWGLALKAQNVASVPIPAGKAIYIPKDLQGMDLQNPESKWSYRRMACTENFVIFWEKASGTICPTLHSWKDMI